MPRVFISYSHDSDEHKARIHALADRLRSDGVTIILDRDMLPGGPPEGWPAWSEAQARDAELVLVACTETYCRRYDLKESPGTGLGAVCEARTIRQLIYNTAGYNEKFRVILFAEEDNGHVPHQLQGYHRFLLYQPSGYEELLAWLRGPQQAPEPQQSQSLVIRWPSPIPDYAWPLADRKDEFAFFEKMVTGQSLQRILLLRGISNTGKTVLLTEFVAYARLLQLPAALLDFKGCPSMDDLFEMLRLDLGQGILRHAHAAAGTSRFFQLISDLQQLSEPLLLVFDTYEQASADAQKWLESQLLPRLDRTPGVLVIIGGQQIPEHGKHPWRALAEARDLPPISRVDEWVEYSQRKWHCPHLNADHVKAFTVVYRGDPGQVSAMLEVLVQGLQADRNV